jgi:hypothetical protein
LIGRSASLRLGPNRFASSTLFQAAVALPGDGKSPCLGYLRAPVGAIDQELDDEFQSEKALYLEKCQAKPKHKPAPPIPRRVVLEDATMEACFRALSKNPRGLLWCLDELGTLVSGLNQYKRGAGNDRPNLLKIWAGLSVVIDRVLNELGEPIRIHHPSLSITGNLPPASLADMINRRGDDGFIDRWLFVYPDRRPKLKSHQRGSVSDEATLDWSRVCRNLWNRPLDLRDNRRCPHVAHFSDVGRATFNRLYDQHVEEVNAADFPDALRGPWAKLEEYAGRLCLVLTMLWYAADPRADSDLLPSVGQDRGRDAWRLVGYFKSNHRRVRAALEGRGRTNDGARLVLNWISNHPEEDTLPESELTRTYPRFRDDRALLEDSLVWLEQRNAIRRTGQDPRTGKPGRKPGPVWEIHPELRQTENTDNPENARSNAAPFGRFADSPDCPYGDEDAGRDCTWVG